MHDEVDAHGDVGGVGRPGVRDAGSPTPAPADWTTRTRSTSTSGRGRRGRCQRPAREHWPRGPSPPHRTRHDGRTSTDAPTVAPMAAGASIGREATSGRPPRRQRERGAARVGEAVKSPSPASGPSARTSPRAPSRKTSGGYEKMDRACEAGDGRLSRSADPTVPQAADAALDGVCLRCREPLPCERCGSAVFKRDGRGGLVEVEPA